MDSLFGFYLSNVVFVACVIAATAIEYVFIKFVLYSCIEEVGERNFEMTHASKKFAFDSHNDSNFVNFAFCSTVATKNKAKTNEIFLRDPNGLSLTNFTYLTAAKHWNYNVFQIIFQIVCMFSDTKIVFSKYALVGSSNFLWGNLNENRICHWVSRILFCIKIVLPFGTFATMEGLFSTLQINWQSLLLG